MALKENILTAKALNLQKVVYEDNEELMRVMKEQSVLVPWEISELVDEIKFLAISIPHVDFSWDQRSANKVAVWAAKNARLNSLYPLWVANLPVLLILNF